MNAFHRRDFLKLSGVIAGELLLGIEGERAMANKGSQVILLKTEDRKEGGEELISCRGRPLNAALKSFIPMKGDSLYVRSNH